MKYTFQKIFIVAVCSILIVVGLIALLGAILGKAGFFGYIFGAMFVLLPSYIAIYKLKELSRFQKMTYEWYKHAYPEKVKDNRISCFECGSNRLHVRALMNRTFHREHFCTQCGKTLYYSPEQG